MTKPVASVKSKRSSLGVKRRGSQVAKKKSPKNDFNVSKDSSMNGKQGTPKGRQSQGKRKSTNGKKKSDEKKEDEEKELQSDKESNESLNDSGDEVSEKKGVKMFKGVLDKSKDNAKNDSSEENEEEEDDDKSTGDVSDIAAEFANDSAASGVSIDMDSDDDDDDAAIDEEIEDDEEDEDSSDESDESDEEEEAKGKNKSSLGLSALLGDSIVDDDDDESFKDEGEDDDDEEMSDDDEEAEVSKMSETMGDEEEEEEDEDSSDEDENGQPDLKDLLGASLASDDDEEFLADEDSDDEDDEAESEDEGEVEEPKPKKSAEEIMEENKRTIYISNVPKDINVKDVKKIFKEYGEIESMRLRGIVPKDPQMSLKVAAITKKIHPKVQTVVLYVKYKDESMARKALVMNGKKLEDNIICVDMAITEKKDPKKAVILGNLPYKTKENDLHEHFAQCGEIKSVRLIRDRRTGLVKGFGYINFANEDSVELALKLNNSEFLKRKIRVKKCFNLDSSKSANRKRQRTAQHQESKKKLKANDGAPKQTGMTPKNKNKGEAQGSKTNTPDKNEKDKSFQGLKADKVNKNKNKKKQTPKSKA